MVPYCKVRDKQVVKHCGKCLVKGRLDKGSRGGFIQRVEPLGNLG